MFPMTLARKQFSISEGWALSRGHTRRLMIILALLFLMALGMFLILAAVGAAAFLALAGTVPNLQEYFGRPAEQIVRDLSPWAVVASVVSGLFGAFAMVVFTAPWATAYRQIAGDGGSPADVFA